MNTQRSRRDFLKLLLLLPLISLLNEQPHDFRGSKRSAADQDAPNILILVFDTLSARHMSLYGYNRKTTPHLAKFAEKATVYHTHHAGGNFTTPGTSSLLTGALPWSHRAFNINARVAESYKHRNLFSAFAGTGYHRIAYTQNRLADFFLDQFREDIDTYLTPTELYLADHFFFDRLFSNDRHIAFLSEEALFGKKSDGSLFLGLVSELWRNVYDRRALAEQYPRGLPGMFKSFFLLEHAIDGIMGLISQSPQPFLGYFHLLPPHNPYNPRREFVDVFEDGWSPIAKAPHFFSEGVVDQILTDKQRRYDEYIAYTDAEVGRLFNFLEQMGLLDNTYVVFTSDHGELFERGIWGHVTPVLYESIVRIPLLISKPKQQREDVYTPTSCIDLLPTLLKVVGQPVPAWCEGKVLPTFGEQEDGSERSIFSVEAKSNAKHAPLTKATVALVRDQYKLIHYFGYKGYENEYELYDLANDPEEIKNLYLSQKLVAADLQHELQEKLQEINQPYFS